LKKQSTELLDIIFAELFTEGALYFTCTSESRPSDAIFATVATNFDGNVVRRPDGALLRINVKDVHCVDWEPDALKEERRETECNPKPKPATESTAAPEEGTLFRSHATTRAGRIFATNASETTWTACAIEI
jgi:hypothetical protein